MKIIRQRGRARRARGQPGRAGTDRRRRLPRPGQAAAPSRLTWTG